MIFEEITEIETEFNRLKEKYEPFKYRQEPEEVLIYIRGVINFESRTKKSAQKFYWTPANLGKI